MFSALELQTRHSRCLNQSLSDGYISRMDKPESKEAKPAIRNENTTPGPASSFAISPATTYIPVPLQLPTPSDVRSNVVRSFFRLISSPAEADTCEISFFLKKNKYYIL